MDYTNSWVHMPLLLYTFNVPVKLRVSLTTLRRRDENIGEELFWNNSRKVTMFVDQTTYIMKELKSLNAMQKIEKWVEFSEFGMASVRQNGLLPRITNTPHANSVVRQIK